MSSPSSQASGAVGKSNGSGRSPSAFSGGKQSQKPQSIPAGPSQEGPAAGEASSRELAEWVAGVIWGKSGGCVPQSSLGPALQADCPEKYKAVKDRFLSVSLLLEKHKDLFVSESKPTGPVIHVNSPPLSFASTVGMASAAKMDSPGVKRAPAWSGSAASTGPLPSYSEQEHSGSRQEEGSPSNTPARHGSDGHGVPRSWSSGGLLAPPLSAASADAFGSALDAEPPCCVATLRTSYDILAESSAKMVKIVDLANVLRTRLPKSSLSDVREKHGGMMHLFSRFPAVFALSRERTAEAVGLLARTKEGSAPALSEVIPMVTPPSSSASPDASVDEPLISVAPDFAVMKVHSIKQSTTGGPPSSFPSRLPKHVDSWSSQEITPSRSWASISSEGTLTNTVGSPAVLSQAPPNVFRLGGPPSVINEDGERPFLPGFEYDYSEQDGRNSAESVYSDIDDDPEFTDPHGGYSAPTAFPPPPPSLLPPPPGPYDAMYDPRAQHFQQGLHSSASFRLARHSPEAPVDVDGVRYTDTFEGEEEGLSGDGSVSRCLHIGNVPATMTEAELLSVLRAHGRVETIKLVCQKGRRFAFCNFSTVDDAVNAKVSLARSDQWRYNVSFAKRETLPLPPPFSVPSSSSGGGERMVLGAPPPLPPPSLYPQHMHGGPPQPLMPPPPSSGGRSSYSHANAAMIESLRHQGYSLEEAAYMVNYSHVEAMPSGGGGPKQRNLTPSRHLWIGGLVNATRADVLDVFGPFGKIEHFKFIKGRRCAFVDFVNQRDAEVAFQKMQGYCLGGSYIDLGFGRPERASSAHSIGMEDLGIDDPAGYGGKPMRVSVHDPLHNMLTRGPRPMPPLAHPPIHQGYGMEGYGGGGRYQQPHRGHPSHNASFRSMPGPRHLTPTAPVFDPSFSRPADPLTRHQSWSHPSPSGPSPHQSLYQPPRYESTRGHHTPTSGSRGEDAPPAEGGYLPRGSSFVSHPPPSRHSSVYSMASYGSDRGTPSSGGERGWSGRGAEEFPLGGDPAPTAAPLLFPLPTFGTAAGDYSRVIGPRGGPFSSSDLL